jgi:hypothetical protein
MLVRFPVLRDFLRVLLTFFGCLLVVQITFDQWQQYQRYRTELAFTEAATAYREFLITDVMPRQIAPYRFRGNNEICSTWSADDQAMVETMVEHLRTLDRLSVELIRLELAQRNSQLLVVQSYLTERDQTRTLSYALQLLLQSLEPEVDQDFCVPLPFRSPPGETL